jgi:hypothetical protein
MITSKQIFNLLEDYAMLVNLPGGKVPIYENPTTSDYSDIKKSTIRFYRKLESIRFIADIENEKVWVWDAYLATHNDIDPKVLSSIGKSSSSPDIIRRNINTSGKIISKSNQVDKLTWLRKYLKY